MSARYVRAPDLLWRRTPTAVLIRSVDGRGWDLAGTGVELWDRLDEPRTIWELARGMRTKFKADSDAICVDLQAVVDLLIEDGVVVEMPPSP